MGIEKLSLKELPPEDEGEEFGEEEVVVTTVATMGGAFGLKRSYW